MADANANAPMDVDGDSSSIVRMPQALLNHKVGPYLFDKLLFDTYGTDQLKSLKASKLFRLSLANIGEQTVELDRYDIKTDEGSFLGLYCYSNSFYVRSGYKELYDFIAKAWKEPQRQRVVLNGNAGTGKSWFQIFALKQLLDCQERDYDIVIRQVKSRFFVFDLKNVMVYEWNPDEKDTAVERFFDTAARRAKRTLYFYEPGENSSRAPLGIFAPSLSTLSPCIARIHEYKKRCCTLCYFWPWQFFEVWALVVDARLNIGFESLCDRYYMFGGILRHVLGETTDAEQELSDRLSNISVGILMSVALNVDRELSGSNVSGYLVCYDNRFAKENRFSTRNLEYTSQYVEDQVAIKLRTMSMKEKMRNMLDHLDGKLCDLSGKILESVAMELLSKGNNFEWQFKEVGTSGNWLSFRPKLKARNIRLTYTARENFTQQSLIIAPTNKKFPVIDFLFSCPSDSTPVVSFQCTWRKDHPFSIRALYDLRCEQLQIDDDRILEIYFISPSSSDCYSQRPKIDFLNGSVDKDLEFLKTKKNIPYSQIQEQWNSTHLYVLKPLNKTGWEGLIDDWLQKNGA